MATGGGCLHVTTRHEFHSYRPNVGGNSGSTLVEVNRTMNESMSNFSPIEELLMRQLLTPAPAQDAFPEENTKFELPHQRAQFEKINICPLLSLCETKS